MRGPNPKYDRGVEADDELARLIRGHLDTVSFVMDYVEFRIDYHVLRALNGPRVELRDGTTASFPEPGSRDALCELIDTEVADARVVREADDPRIEVRTTRGDVLCISLDDTEFPESAHLVPADEQRQARVGGMYIW
jgi:hypothetical protein